MTSPGFRFSGHGGNIQHERSEARRALYRRRYWFHRGGSKRYYTPEYQRLLRGKLARIDCPILLIQGDLSPGNRFNADVLIPELRALNKKVEVLTYAGQPHCFLFLGTHDIISTGLRKLGAPTAPSPPGARQPSSDAQAKAAADMLSFCARHVSTKPKPLLASLVQWR